MFFTRCVTPIASMQIRAHLVHAESGGTRNVILLCVLPVMFSLPRPAFLFLAATSIVKFRLICKENEVGRKWKPQYLPDVTATWTIDLSASFTLSILLTLALSFFLTHSCFLALVTISWLTKTLIKPPKSK